MPVIEMLQLGTSSRASCQGLPYCKPTELCVRLGVRVWRVILKVVIGSCCYWLSFSASTCICIGYDRVVPKSLNTHFRRIDIYISNAVQMYAKYKIQMHYFN